MDAAKAADRTKSEPAMIGVEEAGRQLGISRGSAYQAVHSGQIPSLRVGQRILVPADFIERMLADPMRTT